MSFDPAPAASALHAARLARGQLAPLDPAIAPGDEAAGAAVQRALALRMGVGAPAGFKIGATAVRMQEHLGIRHPAAGFLAADDVHASGAVLPYSAYVNVGVECELAVRLGRDLPPGPCTVEQAAAAVGEVFAAIEVVEGRYGELAAVGVPTLIGDQFFQAASVIGAPGPVAAGEAAGLAARIMIDGDERDRGVGADLLGEPMRCLAWLAGSPVAAAFGGLRAGQVVLLGSVTPPVWLAEVRPPVTVTVSFPPLPDVTLTLA